MLEFFREAFRRDKRKKNKCPESVEAPDLPSLTVTRSTKTGKWVYAQPPNPDYDPETNTITLKTRRSLNCRFESFTAITNPEMLICPVDFASITDHHYLDKALIEAKEYACQIPAEGYVCISDVLRLTFYVYFKQATEGDITEREIKSQPYIFQDWEGYWKVFGWKLSRGLAREEARDKYVSLLNDEVSLRSTLAWAPPGYEELFLTGVDKDLRAEAGVEAAKSDEQCAREKREREDNRWASFFEAVRIVRNFPKKPYQMPNRMRAKFYGLYKQATVGDLEAFQKTDACLNNEHYAWCRQRPANAVLSAKAQKAQNKEREREREKTEKAKKIERVAAEGHSGGARPGSPRPMTMQERDAALDADDPRTFDQMRYDCWLSHAGRDRYDVIREYLTYFYAVGAAHGYVWDPPGSENHMSEVGNQFSTAPRKEMLKAKGIDPDTCLAEATVGANGADVAAAVSPTTGGGPRRPRLSPVATPNVDTSVVHQAAQTVAESGVLSDDVEAHKALQERIHTAAKGKISSVAAAAVAAAMATAAAGARGDLPANRPQVKKSGGQTAHSTSSTHALARHADPVADISSVAAESDTTTRPRLPEDRKVAAPNKARQIANRPAG